VNIECRVEEVLELGTHDMFIASVTAVHGSKELMDDKNVFRLNDAGLIVYSHGTYFSLGREIGTFGFSVSKKKT
jgi:flavin reductase (DIM6/NTAB) family NADH-FMN oxidoreductase RutF